MNASFKERTNFLIDDFTLSTESLLDVPAIPTATERNEIRKSRALCIDNAQNVSGDAFAILEKAKTGAGFHCTHSMSVQHAVMTSMGFVTRELDVDINHEEFGRNDHHGVNEVWSNDYAK